MLRRVAVSICWVVVGAEGLVLAMFLLDIWPLSLMNGKHKKEQNSHS